jgi:hypothetical protein
MVTGFLLGQRIGLQMLPTVAQQFVFAILEMELRALLYY